MSKNKKRTSIILIILLALIGVVAAGYYMYNKKPAKVEDIKAESIDSTNISKLDSSASQFLGKAIIIKGTIKEKTLNQDSSLMIVLEESNGEEVQCSMRDRGNFGNIGENISIKGFYVDKNMFGLVLTDCIVIK